MKQVIIFTLILIIGYMVYSIYSIDYFQVGIRPLFDIKSYIEKTRCAPYEKHSVNCYKTILKKFREEFRQRVIDTYSGFIIKNEFSKIKPKSNECYINLNNFPSSIVGNIMNFTKNIDENRNKMNKIISNSQYFEIEDIGFIQIYKIIQENIKKYNKNNITSAKIPIIEDIFIPDKDECEIPKYLNSERDVEQYIRNNISKHYIGKIMRLLDTIDTDTDNGTIELYDVDKLETALKGAVLESEDMAKISGRIMGSLGVVSRTISKYYCSKYVRCCHKEECENILELKKQSKDKRMLELYNKKYKKCQDKNQKMRRQTYVKQSNLCKKIDLK